MPFFLQWAERFFLKFQPSRLGLRNTPTAALPLHRGKTPINECPEYNTKRLDVETGPLWPGVEFPNLVQPMGPIELFVI